MITFTFNPEKFASTVAYMAQRVPGLKTKQICKLLYFADKEHLLRYGRTITGDVYCALPQGHIPSKGLDAINGKAKKVGKYAVGCVRRYGHLTGAEFVVDHEPDMKVFSRSDRKVLDEIIDKMGDLTASALERKSHNEPSWRKTEPNGRVDFELFFEGHPEAALMKEILLEENGSPSAPQREELAIDR
jgi:uncharacterized phage-associated protein